MVVIIRSIGIGVAEGSSPSVTNPVLAFRHREKGTVNLGRGRWSLSLGVGKFN